MTNGDYGQQPEQYGQQPPPGQYGPPPPGQYGQQPPPPEYGQQPAGQPGQYGPPAPGQYGQQPAEYSYVPPTNPYGARPPVNRRSFGSAGLIVAAIGVIAIVLGFTVFNWFSGGTSHFSDVKKQVDLADKAGIGFTPAKLYFDWLGWVLLAVVAIIAVLACLPIVASRVWQPVGLLVGLIGVGVTFVAILLVSGHGGPGYTEYLKHARVGFYVTAAGFLVAGIGAAIGSRKNTVR